MATLLRFSRQSRLLLSNLAKSRTKFVSCCQISTSEKKKDVVANVEPPITAPQPKSQELKELEEHFADADPAKLKVDNPKLSRFGHFISFLFTTDQILSHYSLKQ